MGKYKGNAKEIVKSVKTSSELYQEILDNSTAKGRRSIANLKKMCDGLEERGMEINVAVLGREADRLGISPREEALRNNPKLWSYVQLRVSEQELVEKELKGDFDLVETIRQLRKENSVLRAFIKKINLATQK